MPGLSGLEVAERLPGRRVIIVTTFGRSGHLSRALAAGVAGYVVKDTPAAELAAAIARRLFLTEGTVRDYLSSAIGKTGARHRAEAARVAESRGRL
ncbi:two-component system, NarL family, response regulator DesR [Nonomuraea solani]|uniref:Two-component system, NarL family, response regulator DesR n=1 Tax=Nonomuraea solani TaxID=1144553 RepID=A0A1H6F189_9ACTN|nr:two-component system, NarL family, response regulator DesR [Nonomuraea solani]